MTRTTFSIDRRSLLIGMAAVAAVPGAAVAMTQEQARDLIGRVMADLGRIIDSGAGEAQLFRDFEALFARYGDVPVIAQSVLGPTARSASRAQLTAFTAAFQGYMARKYGRQFRRMRGARAEVAGARQVQRYWEVVSTMNMRGEAPFEVRWHVSDRSGQQRFFNMIIEGVNILSTERSEMGTMLERRRGNLDQLIQDLRTAG